MTAWHETPYFAQRFARKYQRFVSDADWQQHRERYAELFGRYAAYTLIPERIFCDNLALIDERLRQLDGAIVECGTWKGGMAAAMMQLGGPARAYHFYDSFAGLPPAQTSDGEDALAWQAATDDPHYHDNLKADADAFRALVAEVGFPAGQVQVHEGWFSDTVPRYDGPPIAVLRLDGDWYESTMTCLEALYPQVQLDGVVILDDYDTWDGCSRAVHDYLSRTQSTARIRRTGSSSVAFIHKLDA